MKGGIMRYHSRKIVLIGIFIFSLSFFTYLNGENSGSGRWILKKTQIIPDSGRFAFENKWSTERYTVSGGNATHMKKSRKSVRNSRGNVEVVDEYSWFFSWTFDPPPKELIPGQKYTLKIRGSGQGRKFIANSRPRGYISYKSKGGTITPVTATGEINHPGLSLDDVNSSRSKSFILTVTKGIENNSYYGGKVFVTAGFANCYIQWEYVYGSGDESPGEDEEALSPPGDCGKGSKLSGFLERLRVHGRNLAAIERTIDRIREGRLPGRNEIMRIGKDALSEGGRFLETFTEFARSETRKGFIEELDLLVGNMLTMNQIVAKYQQLRKLPVTKLTPPTAKETEQSLAGEALQLAKERMAMGLKSEGLRDILISSSWNEAVEKTAHHADRKVREFLERETSRMFGLGFYDLDSARRALQLKMRREIYRQVAKLLVKVTSNEIIIELVAGPVIRWIEGDLIPRLREALRYKGNLAQRVERSGQSMERGRRMLFSLPCNSRIRDVLDKIGSANGIIHAAKYLEKDLKRERNYELLNKLAIAQGNLGKAIQLTRVRFLVSRSDYLEDMETFIPVLRQMLSILERSLPAGTTENRFFRQQNMGGISLPSLYSTVAELRFYEGGNDNVPSNQRVYKLVFPASKTKYIWWELKLAHSNVPRKIYFNIESIWKDSYDKIISQSNIQYFIPMNGQSTYYSGGFGARHVNNWKPGPYSVELRINGRFAAKGWITVENN